MFDRFKKDPLIGYCVKCRDKREMKKPELYIMKNNKEACKSICGVCGTTIFRIGKMK